MIDFNSSKKKIHPFVKAIDSIEYPPDEKRNYIGASIIGKECSRAIQYSFFGTPVDEGKELPNRIKRIFERGHEGEKMMLRWMKMAGFEVDGTQTGFMDLFFGGHCDGIIRNGPEDCGPYPRLWEAKVVNRKGFNKVKKHKLKKAYPVYYAQIQIYQAYLDLYENPALISILNADDMDIEVEDIDFYSEDIEFNQKAAQELSDKAANIMSACEAGEQLPKLSDDPDYYLCRFCDWKERCHY